MKGFIEIQYHGRNILVNVQNICSIIPQASDITSIIMVGQEKLQVSCSYDCIKSKIKEAL